MRTRKRLDLLLVSRELVESQEKARRLIMAGQVLVDERLVDKPGSLVPEDAPIRLQERLPYVSRGGLKLAHALDEFGLKVADWVALDIGASTGGFTDCLLQRGARRVYAVDVGYGQLDYRLRQDSHVVVMERVNARYPFTLLERVELITVDLSFISVTKVLPNLFPWLQPRGWLLVLLKPQFEAGRREVGKGGLIKDPLVHARVLGRFLVWAVGQKLRLAGLTPSSLRGATGNREFFVLLRLPKPRARTPS